MRRTVFLRYPQIVIGLFAVTTFAMARLNAADQPQWGQRHTRNMVSAETGLPDTFDPETGKNVKWSVRLGSQSYSTPVISGGKVLIGTNNDEVRNPRHKGDRGVLVCLDEKDGSLCWQLVVPKLEGDIYLDWPRAGICSPATVEGDKVYVVTNRDEVLCLDLAGQANGNDGPFRDEGRFMAPDGQPPVEVSSTDADILWCFDMKTGVGMYPHDSAHASILIDGPYLYLNTCNGLDNTHHRIRAPKAPSLIVLDKTTGRLVAQDDEQIGPRIFHSTWASPSMATAGGRKLVFFGGGDGVVYAFDPPKPSSAGDPVQKLKRVWRFDCDPTSAKEDVHRFIGNRKESPSIIKGMPVFHKDRIYVTVGGDIWWGKNEAWLKCIDATREGDITADGQRWSYPLKQHSCATPSIADGLVYAVDCGRTLHCVDAETGQPCWTHDLKGDMWGSTLVADGKVYVGTRRGLFWIFAAGKEKKLVAEVNLGDPISATPVAANGTLYIATLTRLFAVAVK